MTRNRSSDHSDTGASAESNAGVGNNAHPKSRAFSSLYSRISLIFLLLIVTLGTVQVFLTVRSAMNFVQESDQALNRSLAGDLATVFEPFLRDSLDYAGIEHTIHELMVMNPRVEIYILDAAGNLQAYFADPASIKRMAVDLAPVEQLLAQGAEGHLPVRGDDPRSPVGRKPFSAAPVMIGGDRPGYVYVILGGEQYDSAAEMIRGSYIIRTTAVGLLVTVAFTAIVGLILFFLITRRLGALTDVVQRFHAGDMAQRAAEEENDEIGRLGRVFNRMADTIVANMDKLRETDRLRRELIANVSHDLRSPLASIQGYLETILMKDDTLGPSERRRFLDTIVNNVRVLSKLVEQLFELSKLDAKHTSPHCEAFSLGELVQDVTLMFKPHAEGGQVQLRTEIPPDLPPVAADIAMIERALSNLIENALRYTPPQGKVTVRLEPVGEKVTVAVTDTGCGIPAEDLPRVFDRFYRVEKSRSRASGGTGLGLAIASKIVQAHGQQIRVDSNVGVGTTFSFDLLIPAAARQAALV